ncbi:MAG: tRNA (5-methylaminomethyl-2-thiouridine)(34)-methyltransferase MnmD [Bacteroidales bacterium]|nr:tRNA (5-methylaminomethyl-2-thiouridine)(34)-methyltransferase MnmD [Bacteroidales bacterium]
MNKPILTSDGSHTLFHRETGEHYHSTFGAITESEHIFVRAGLDALSSKIEQIELLEIGLGTGLNALLALRWAEKNKRRINYFAVEAFPLKQEIISRLNYTDRLDLNPEKFAAIHQPANKQIQITKYFFFECKATSLQDVELPVKNFDLVFFDAFSPDVQPGMWKDACFKKIAKAMKPGGILTTYSCKGTVKRALKTAGFQLEKLPGPPGKREFLRAVRSGREVQA